MAAQSKAELKNRWTTPDGENRAVAVVRAWNAAESLDRLELGRVAGRIDLRGFVLPAIERAGPVQVDGITVTELATEPPRVFDARIADVDLTGAALSDLTFDGCTFDNVVGDGASLTDVGFVGCDIASSTFRSARVIRGVLSTGEPDRFRTPPVQRGTAFRGCMFTRARIVDSVCDFALFEDCDLTGGVISGISFYRPVIRRCQIGGKLADVQFDGRSGIHAGPEIRPALVDVDFTAANFVDVDFDTIPVERPTWPSAHRYVVLRGDVTGFFGGATRMLEAIPAKDRVLIDEYIERGIRQTAPGQDEWFVQTDMFGADPAEHAFEQQAEDQLVRLATSSEVSVTAEVHLPT